MLVQAMLSVCLITFNMNSKVPPSIPASMLQHDVLEGRDCDMYLIGTQESGSLRDFERLLQQRLGFNYVRLAADNLMAIGIMLFVKQSLRQRCSEVRRSSVATGKDGMAWAVAPASASLLHHAVPIVQVTVQPALRQDAPARASQCFSNASQVAIRCNCWECNTGSQSPRTQRRHDACCSTVSAHATLERHGAGAGRSHVAKCRCLLSALGCHCACTGVGNVLGNKGGVAISLTYEGTKFAFISSHFAAHDHKVEERNDNYHRIRTGLFSRPELALSDWSFTSLPGTPKGGGSAGGSPR